MDIQIILYSILILGIIALISSVVLHFVSKAFKVVENPHIDNITEILPGANCGGCGLAGCRNLAENIVKAGTLDGFFCPAGGNAVSERIAEILGLEVVAVDPQIAVVRCNGSCNNAPAKTHYNGAASCAFASSLYVGESACPSGCIGIGDCVNVCTFEAIYIDAMTGLPYVEQDKCVGCGACVKACPRLLVQLRDKGKKDKRVYVSCRNTEKGAIAKKNCAVACIGCGKCEKNCAFEAITVENNLAYIDDKKCKLCRKCVAECPTGSITECNFPVQTTAATHS